MSDPRKTLPAVVQWRKNLCDDRQLNKTTKLVLAFLSFHWPNIRVSQSTLSEECGLSRQCVNDHLEIARAQGWIKRTNYGKPGATVDTYELIPRHPSGFKSDSPTPVNQDDRVCQPGRQGYVNQDDTKKKANEGRDSLPPSLGLGRSVPPPEPANYLDGLGEPDPGYEQMNKSSILEEITKYRAIYWGDTPGKRYEIELMGYRSLVAVNELTARDPYWDEYSSLGWSTIPIMIIGWLYLMINDQAEPKSMAYNCLNTTPGNLRKYLDAGYRKWLDLGKPAITECHL